MKTNWKKWIAMKVLALSRRLVFWAFTEDEIKETKRDLDEQVRKLEEKENEKKTAV